MIDLLDPPDLSTPAARLCQRARMLAREAEWALGVDGQDDLAARLVRHCASLGIDAVACAGQPCPRLRAALAALQEDGEKRP